MTDGKADRCSLVVHVCRTQEALSCRDPVTLEGKIPAAALGAPGTNYRRFLLARPQPRSKQFPLDLDVVDFTR